MLIVQSAGKIHAPQTSMVSGAVKVVMEQGKMSELIIAGVMIAIVLIAVLVSWINGKRSGAESQQLDDALDHQEKILKAAMEQRALELKLKNEELKIRARADEPLTQAAVDKMLEKYKNRN